MESILDNTHKNTKVCTKCKIEKPLDQFSHKRPKNRKPGLQPRCKDCSIIDTRDWVKKNPDKVKSRRIIAYGITVDQYNQLYDEQSGKCIICERLLLKFGPPLEVACIDHDHNTGKVRGLLCNGCNRGIGYLSEDIDNLKRAINYLEKHNAIPKKWCPPVR